MAVLKKIEKDAQRECPCAVCGSSAAEAVYQYDYEGKAVDIVRCHLCGHLFAHPLPLTDFPSRRMESVEDAELFGSKLLKRLYKNMVIMREIRNVKKIIKTPSPRLLDIGCGTGWTTGIWRENGFVVTGLESSETRYHVARERYGLNVITKPVEEYETGQDFDIVIMRHVLEHIAQPDKVLMQVKKILKKDGVFLIVVPNIDCVGRHLFRENWEWVLPWHLHFFTPRILRRLLENQGFKIECLYQTASPLWYAPSLARLLGEGSFWGRCYRKVPVFMRLLPTLPLIGAGVVLRKNDNITVFARKNGP